MSSTWSSLQKALRVFRRPYSVAATTTETRSSNFMSEFRAKSHEVPTINIASYLKNPNSFEARSILDQVRQACLGTGFFQIVGHGISRKTQQATFDAAARFFALPFEEKCKLDAKKSLGHRGYDVLASQAYEDGLLPDLKEGFYIGEDLPLEDPRVQAKRFFMGQNVWPSSGLLSHSEFRAPAEAYFKAVRSLAEDVMRMIARTLPYGDNVFDEFLSNNPVTPLRLLHYPPRRETETPQFGSSPHTDFGAITLLLQDSNPGLQVLHDGEWIPVPPERDAYVVNVGDMLSKWTGNAYKSSVHRVLNQNDRDRYSIVFFHDGNLDCKLAPLDGSAPDTGKVLTVEEHMLHRMAESYGKGTKS